MLKKSLLIYHLIIGLYGIIGGLYVILDARFNSLSVFWILLGLAIVFLSCKGLLRLKNNKIFYFLFLFNLLQIMAFSIFRISYKFIYGTELFMYFSHLDESIFQIQARYWIGQFHIKILKEFGLFIFGINIPQLFLTILIWKTFSENTKKEIFKYFRIKN